MQLICQWEALPSNATQNNFYETFQLPVTSPSLPSFALNNQTEISWVQLTTYPVAPQMSPPVHP